MTLAQLFDLAFGNIGRFFKEIAFKKEERGKLSYGLVGTLILVLTYGLIMLFSASYSTGYYRFKGDIYHFIRPQVILAVVGLVLMYLISNINYRSLRHMNWYLYILTLLLLVWALFSEPYNGCYRWVYMFGTTLRSWQSFRLFWVLPALRTGIMKNGEHCFTALCCPCCRCCRWWFCCTKNPITLLSC